MTFANPLALLWGLLAIPIVILYLRRIRLRREPVATDMIWEQVFAAQRARSLWQRWRHGVSLAVQLIVLLLVVVALAEPLIPPPRRIVLIIDNSAGMNAADVKPTRLARAKQAAGRLITGLRNCDRMAILSAGGVVSVHCSLSSDHATLQEALDAVPATKGPNRMNAAVALARRVIADTPGGEIVVLSDGCFDGAAELAAADDVQLLRVGKRVGNVAVTRLRARRNITDPLRCQTLLRVSNFSEEPVECRLDVALDGRPLDSVPIKLAPDGRWQQVFEMTTPEAGRLRARLDDDLAEDGDAWQDDNQATTHVPPAPVHRVVLVTEGNLYLQSALEANPLVELTVTDTPPQPPKGTIVVLDGKVPNRLPDGPVLVVNPRGSCDLWQLGDALEDPTVAGQDEGAPLLTDVRLQNVLLPEARRLELTEKTRASARAVAWTADGTPLAFRVERPAGRVLVLCGDLQRSNLRLSTAFPIMMTNALSWLAGEDDWALGDSPGRKAGDEGLGIWVPGESDLRVPSNLGVDLTKVIARRPGPPPWLYLVGLCVLLAAVEWCLYERRWIV